MARPQPKDTIGEKRYLIQRVIGEGGMGAVFEAKDTRLECQVAIKWLRADLPAESAIAEGRAGARVRHPNVVHTYDVAYEGDSLFLVMELMQGETLGTLLAREEIPVPTLLALLIQAMRGVAEAHRCGVVHRDIKPDNIFLAREKDRSEPVAKVLDFGIAKVEGLGTHSGIVRGTPLFMSLEQARGARDLDGRADVYSFGVILYLALTGLPPFRPQTLADLAHVLTSTKPQPLHALVPEIPVELSSIVMRAIEVDRSARTGNLEMLIRDLTPFAAGAPPLRRSRDGSSHWTVDEGALDATGMLVRTRPASDEGSGADVPSRDRSTPARSLPGGSDGRTRVASPVDPKPVDPKPPAELPSARPHAGSPRAEKSAAKSAPFLWLAAGIVLGGLALVAVRELRPVPAPVVEMAQAPAPQPVASAAARPLEEDAPRPVLATTVEEPASTLPLERVASLTESRDASLDSGDATTTNAPAPARTDVAPRTWDPKDARARAPARGGVQPPVTSPDAGAGKLKLRACEFVGNCPL